MVLERENGPESLTKERVTAIVCQILGIRPKGVCRDTLTGHTNGVLSVSFSPNGTTIASASYDHTVRICKATTGALVRPLTGHTAGVSSVSFSPDGTTIASASADHTVRIWDAATGAPLKELTGHTH